MSVLMLYNKKRNFTATNEPAGKVEKGGDFKFVIQKHEATHLHYDFRLQLDGVLKSWAVPKGPSGEAGEKRLAVMVEDHPVSYISFKGTIPAGNYGAGKVTIWDNGSFTPIDENVNAITEKQAIRNLIKGELKFIIKGKKLKGSYVLVRMKDGEKNWLLIKHKDAGQVKIKKGSITHPQKTSQSVGNTGKKLKDYQKPMLAHISEKPFSDKDWVFEIKWDGYRAIAEIGAEIRFYSRNGINYKERFPSILKAIEKIKHHCIIDGEVVWLHENGKADFQQLQHYDPAIKGSLVFQAFDLLSLDNKDTRNLHLLERKKLLKKLLGNNKLIRYTPHVAELGEAFFSEAGKLGLEGIMAKKVDSTYVNNYRSRAWLKIKYVQNEDVYIAGFTAPRGSRSKFGSLILATKKGNDWQYAGHVGTGFNAGRLNEIHEMLSFLVTDKNPFGKKIPVNDTPTWVKPEMVAEISFSEKTRDGIFRHPSFKRIRGDKVSLTIPDANNKKKVNDKQNEKQTEVVKAGAVNVSITNSAKIFWPREGYTKGDMINYYNDISKYILPYLKDRPLSLKRNPNGILDEGFYHKDAGENVPSFVKTFPYKNENKTIDYIVCNNAATLVYLANLGCIEFNPWNNRIQHPDKPDWLLIDIDPGKKNDFNQVIDVARAAKELMDKAKLKGYCKTSGATGLHIYIPLHAVYNYAVVKQFAEIFMHLLNEQLPDFTSMVRSLAKRGDNIYLDYLQNRTGQTLASAYSIRPVPGAPVSTPLEWKEVKAGIHPADFNFKNIFKRIEKKGDLFKPVLTGKSNLQRALKLLNS